ncbi:metal ABC transporter permease [Patescibacteria group bacterium]|nr:metal ABC transporter permease [Patescibacteria group bacterium]
MTTQLALSFTSGIMISSLAAYLGTLMLSKRMSVVAGPIAHLAFPGVALAIVYGFNLAWGVFPFVLIGALLIWILERKTKLPMENLSAVIFAVGVGSSLLFLPIGEAEEALVGNIMHITPTETAMIIILSLITFFLINKIYNTIMLINIHGDLVKVDKKNISIYNLSYLLAIAIVVALGVYLVGGLITVALIAIPAGTSRNISKSLCRYKFAAIFFGILGTIAGIILSLVLHLPTGPMIIISGAFLFLISLIFQQRQNLG